MGLRSARQHFESPVPAGQVDRFARPHITSDVGQALWCPESLWLDRRETPDLFVAVTFRRLDYRFILACACIDRRHVVLAVRVADSKILTRTANQPMIM